LNTQIFLANNNFFLHLIIQTPNYNNKITRHSRFVIASYPIGSTCVNNIRPRT